MRALDGSRSIYLMDTCGYLVEFTVPNDVNIEERPPEADPVPNPVLERVRAALAADERFRLQRVTPVIRLGDQRRQQMLILVRVVCLGGLDDDRRAAQKAVCDDVERVIPSAVFYGIENAPRTRGGAEPNPADRGFR